jgi:pilus assembly protein TadC
MASPPLWLVVVTLVVYGGLVAFFPEDFAVDLPAKPSFSASFFGDLFGSGGFVGDIFNLLSVGVFDDDLGLPLTFRVGLFLLVVVAWVAVFL